MSRFHRGQQLPFNAFWKLYLEAHRKPATRLCHYAATLLGVATSLIAALVDELFVAAGGIACAVALAIGSHRLIEHNRPLIAVNPFYGAIADLRMCWLALTGGLHQEYERLGLTPTRPARRLAKQPTV